MELASEGVALVTQQIEQLKQRGIDKLDLGGVNTHDLPGISRFKISTGGEVITYAGGYV